MLAMKSFTIFHLIEKLQWVLLSAAGVFALCSSTESTNKAINDCAALLDVLYSHDALESINHKVEVGWSLFARNWCHFSIWWSAFNESSPLLWHEPLCLPFTLLRYCCRLKSSSQRSSFKAGRSYSPVDISTSTWGCCTRSSIRQLLISWFYCSSTSSEPERQLIKL